MKRLSRLRFAVFPDNGLFRVYGLGARPGRGEVPELSGGSLLACGYDHLELSTLQGKVDVTVVLEEWDGDPDAGPPPADEGPWEETAAATVFLRGYVTVGTDASGRAMGTRLAGGTGRYRVEVGARHRHAVAERYDRLLQRYRDLHSEEFRVAEQDLRGLEEFLIRLWPMAAADGDPPHGGGVSYPTAVSG